MAVQRSMVYTDRLAQTNRLQTPKELKFLAQTDYIHRPITVNAFYVTRPRLVTGLN